MCLFGGVGEVVYICGSETKKRIGMKKLVLALVACVLALMLSACVRGAKYVVQDDCVVYRYWTFSFGWRNDTLPGADVATFEQLSNWLGHDSERVYYEDKLVPGADVSSLEVVRKPLFRDKRDYYYQAGPMHVRDVASFEVLKWFEDDFWARDARCVYYDTVCIDDADLPSFTILEMSTAKDKRHVYYFGRVIPDADPATYEILGNSVYSRDKSHIWCGDDLVEGADYETFTVDDISAAHDKHGSFRWEKRDTLAVE